MKDAYDILYCHEQDICNILCSPIIDSQPRLYMGRYGPFCRPGENADGGWFKKLLWGHTMEKSGFC